MSDARRMEIVVNYENGYYTREQTLEHYKITEDELKEMMKGRWSTQSIPTNNDIYQLLEKLSEDIGYIRQMLEVWNER